MRVRLLRGLASAALSVAVVVPGAARPARADEGSDQVFDLAVTIAEGLLSRSPGGLTAAEIGELVLQVVTKVNSSRDHIVTTLESLAVADVAADARNSLRTVSYLNRSQVTVENYVLQVGAAADRADFRMRVLTGSAEIDAVGGAMMSLFTIAMTGYPKAGLDSDPLLNDYRNALQSFINNPKMQPTCYTVTGPEPGSTSQYRCRAYDGTEVAATEQWVDNHLMTFTFRDNEWKWVEGRITDQDRVAIQGKSMENTNKPAAVAALQALAQL